MDSKSAKKLWKDFPWLWAIQKKWYWEWDDHTVKVKFIDDEFIDFLKKTPDTGLDLWYKTRVDIGEELCEIPLKNDTTYLQQIFIYAAEGIQYLITADPFGRTITIYRPPKGKNINQIIESLKESKIKW